MPIYEYECGECGVQFQKLQHFGDAPPATCPQGHSRVHRLFSQPAIIFKGSGFYVTDNRRNGATSTSGKSDGKKGKAGDHSASGDNSAVDNKTTSETKTDTKSSE